MDSHFQLSYHRSILPQVDIQVNMQSDNSYLHKNLALDESRSSCNSGSGSFQRPSEVTADDTTKEASSSGMLAFFRKLPRLLFHRNTAPNPSMEDSKMEMNPRDTESNLSNDVIYDTEPNDLEGSQLIFGDHVYQNLHEASLNFLSTYW